MNAKFGLKKLAFIPLFFCVLSVIMFVVRKVSYLTEGDAEGFFLYAEDMWEGTLIAIVLSILLILLNKAKVKKNYLGLGLAIGNILFLVITLLGLLGGVQATSSIDLVRKGAFWRFLYDINPCYELILKLSYDSIMIEVSLILQCIFVIISIVGGFVFSVGVFLDKSDCVKKVL